jgi:hypothetical protein
MVRCLKQQSEVVEPDCDLGVVWSVDCLDDGEGAPQQRLGLWVRDWDGEQPIDVGELSL